MQELPMRRFVLPATRLSNRVPPLNFWTGVASMVDLFGTFTIDDRTELEEITHSSLHDDARRLHRDWVEVLPEAATFYDKRQLRLNFETATSGE